jgi:hypothetical protein
MLTNYSSFIIFLILSGSTFCTHDQYYQNYDNQTYENQTYDNQTYDNQTYDNQAYDSTDNQVYQESNSQLQESTDNQLQEGAVETVEQKDPVIAHFELNVEFLLSNFAYLFPNYTYKFQSFDDSDESQKSLKIEVDFYGPNVFEHLFSLDIEMNKESKKFYVTIDNTKVQKVSFEYEQTKYQQFNLQLPMYQAFIKEALRYNPALKGTLKLKTISRILHDLRHNLKPFKIQRVRNNEDDQETLSYNFTIHENDIYIGWISLSFYETDKEDLVQKMHISQNFVHSITMEVMKDNNLVQLTEEIPAFDLCSTKYNAMISKLTKFVDAKESINSTADIEKTVQEYFKKRIPKMKWEKTKSKNIYTNTEEESINLLFEFSNKALKLDKKVNEQGYTYYNLSVQGLAYTPEAQAEFSRCSKNTLFKILDDAKFNKIFKTIYDDVIDMFEDKFKIIQDKLVKEKGKKKFKSLQNYTTSSGMMNYASQGKSNEEFKVDFSEREEKGKKVAFLTLEAKSVSFSFARNFEMKTFPRQSVQELINLFFEAYMQMQ